MEMTSITFILEQSNTEFLITDIFKCKDDAITHLKRSLPKFKYEDEIKKGIISTIRIESRLFKKIEKQGHFFVSFNSEFNEFGYPTPVLIRSSKITLINDHKKLIDKDATEKTLFNIVKNTSLCWTIQIR